MLLKIFLPAFFLLASYIQAEYQYNLSICALFQNEAPYLKEWIEYHKLLGVDHFYLFNHYSTDNYLEELKPYLIDGTVELKDELTIAENIQTYYPMQCKCYTNCAFYARGKSKWVAFIDIDEFLLPITSDTLTVFLVPYEPFGGVGVNWRLFGTANIKMIPQDKLMIEVLTACTEKNYGDNRYVKCIVRPERVLKFNNAHLPEFQDGYFGVNTDKFPFQGPFSVNIVDNKLRINHYFTRDEHFFYQVKVPRHKKWGTKIDPQQLFQKMNKEQDDRILRFVPKLREALLKSPHKMG